ncbi:ROK family protein, partial [Enterococcus sp. S181_ASV_20]|nr:ROK family protein [Enterococcus sp. S181_ASV_20]
GCLESVASATGMLNLSKDLAQKFSEKSALKKKILSESTLTVKEVFDEARQQEPLALLILNTFSAYIGLACSHIANILD